ncbi:saccharopine dehydrogenase NADP-binding domain-containing protein [Streptomyces sp. NPDC005438]|uniref:saccharopine dehydrogenase NADP-binding domain-containing protein n=1 Tax=Streptomyces sp. NPDC005438 TaxID=3156880 RepID=UPI0033A45CAD
MTEVTLIGLGEVGTEAARMLAASAGTTGLTVAGRRPGRLTERLERAGVRATVRYADLTDPGSLRALAEETQVLVNCAGPAEEVGNRLVRAAVDGGADLVDVGGDDVLHRQLDQDQLARAGRVVVVSAGLRPGLTGLLPRAVANRLAGCAPAKPANPDGPANPAGPVTRDDPATSGAPPGPPRLPRPLRLRAVVGVLDRFTLTAARDYLDASELVRPLATWRDGAVSPRTARRGQEELPFLGPVPLLPGLDPEAERLAVRLGLEHGDWATALRGEHVARAFDLTRGADPATAAEALSRASQLDLTGRTPSTVLLFEVTGPDGTRCLVLRGERQARLSAATLTATVLALGGGPEDRAPHTCPPGAHFAAEVLDPEWTLRQVRTAAPEVAPLWHDGPLTDLLPTEEGLL